MHSAVAGFLGMVDSMRAHQPSQVGAAGKAYPSEPAMRQHIVHEQVSQAIRGHSHPASGPNRMETVRAMVARAAIAAIANQSDGNQAEEKPEKIVGLEPALALDMMGLVQDPKRAVHEPFVERPRHDLHTGESGDKGGKKEGGKDGRRHRAGDNHRVASVPWAGRVRPRMKASYKATGKASMRKE